MTREEVEMVKVLVAFGDGRIIEFRKKGEEQWSVFNKKGKVTFDIGKFEYRIKR